MGTFGFVRWELLDLSDGNFWICQMGTFGFVRWELLDLSDGNFGFVVGNLQICHHMDTFELVSWNFFPHLVGSRDSRNYLIGL